MAGTQTIQCLDEDRTTFPFETMSQMTSMTERDLLGSSVTADELVRFDSHSPVIHLDHRRLISSHTHHFKVGLKREELVSNPPSSLWPLSIEVATECRMQNVECSLVNDSDSSNGDARISLVFSTTRTVERGQRLYFWFSEAMLARLEMPFLVPKNIQGGDRYVCHRCSAVFPTPNPLKLHLFFHCSHRSVPLLSLWSRVLQVLVKPTYQPPKPALFLPPVLYHRPTSASTTPAQVESLVSHLGRSKHGHVCIYCGKVYSRKYGLKIHIRTHTGYKPLKCPVCSRPFGDPSNLNKHIRLHAEHQQGAETPYKCELCGKVLVRRRDLDRHMQSRHSSGSPIQQHQSSRSDEVDDGSPLSSSAADESGGSSRDVSDEEEQLDIIEIC